MGRYREDVYEPVPRMRLFDEGVVDSYRVSKVLKGHMRLAGLKDYAQGRGDFETLCRALTMLGELYDYSCEEFYSKSVFQAFRLFFCGQGDLPVKFNTHALCKILHFCPPPFRAFSRKHTPCKPAGKNVFFYYTMSFSLCQFYRKKRRPKMICTSKSV